MHVVKKNISHTNDVTSRTSFIEPPTKRLPLISFSFPWGCVTKKNKWTGIPKRKECGRRKLTFFHIPCPFFSLPPFINSFFPITIPFLFNLFLFSFIPQCPSPHSHSLLYPLLLSYPSPLPPHFNSFFTISPLSSITNSISEEVF